MEIKRPLIILNTIMTSRDVRDARILHLGIVKINLDQKITERVWKVNPIVSIPASCTATYGITDAMVEKLPTFKQVAQEIADQLSGCDLAGYGSDYFHIPILIKEFEKTSVKWPQDNLVCIDVLTFERILNPNTLSAVYQRRFGTELPNGNNDVLTNARATLEVLLHQVEGNNKITPSEIEEICYAERKRFDLSRKTYIDKNGIVRWALGTHKDKSVTDNMEHFNYILKSDFPEETKQKLRTLIK